MRQLTSDLAKVPAPQVRKGPLAPVITNHFNLPIPFQLGVGQWPKARVLRVMRYIEHGEAVIFSFS